MFAKKTMFGGSAALLLPTNQMFETEDKMEKLLHAIGPYKNDIILALDEIQVLMNEQFGPRYGELLKSILDTSPEGLPYVIAATTQEEYQKYIASDASRARRFKVIYINPLEEEQVKLVLREMMRLHFPQVSVSEEILDNVYQTTQELCHKHTKLTQPEISKRILTSAISQISINLLQSPEEEELKQAQIKLDNLQSRYLTFFDTKDSQVVEKVMQTTKEQVDTLKITVLRKSEGIKKYQNISERLTNCKRKLQILAERTRTHQSLNKRLMEEKRFFFYFHHMIPYLNEQLNHTEEEYNLNMPKLDAKLIADLVKEFQKSYEQATQSENLREKEKIK